MHSNVRGSQAALPAERRRIVGATALGRAFDTLKETLRKLPLERPMELSAALSYYTLLSLAPLVIVTVAAVSLVFDRSAVESRLMSEMRDLLGASGAEVVQTVLSHSGAEKHGFIALGAGIVTLLIGATTVFVQLQDAFNRIWNAQVRARSSTLGTLVRQRLLSLAMVFGSGFLLLVSLLASAALSAIDDWIGASIRVPEWTLHAADIVVSLLVISVLLALIFKFLPDARVRWRDVAVGGFVTAILFTAGKFLIGLYLGRAAVGSLYGAASSLVVLMVWVYYASLIVLFGAELTHVLGERRARE
jgi:membrane protein